MYVYRLTEKSDNGEDVLLELFYTHPPTKAEIARDVAQSSMPTAFSWIGRDLTESDFTEEKSLSCTRKIVVHE